MTFQANYTCKINCAIHKVSISLKYNVQNTLTKPQIGHSNLDSIWHQFQDDETSHIIATYFGLHVV
jgi:hypothetical protein